MRRFDLWSLRVRVALLVLLTVVPALALLVYSAAAQRRQAAAAARETTLYLVRSITREYEGIIESTHQLLSTLALVPPVRAQDGATASALFADLLETYPLYANIAAALPNGDLLASGLPVTGRVTPLGRLYFHRALETRQFAIGEFQIGRVTRKATINFGYPVLDEAGRVQAVVFAALDLTWLNQRAREAQLPEGSVVVLFDRKGVVLVHHPDSARWVGKLEAEAPLVKTILARSSGWTESPGLDGVPRTYAFTPLRGPAESPGAYLAIGIPEGRIYGEANRALARNLLLLGLATALVLAVAWVGSERLVLNRVDSLVQATNRLSSGDLSARAGLPHGRDELGRLAAAFDEMAGSLERLTRQNLELTADLERRVEERTAQLEAARALFVGLLESAPDAIVTVDQEGRITLVNAQAEKVLGYRREELTGQMVEILVPERYREIHVRHRAGYLTAPRTRPMGVGLALYARRKDGSELPVEISLSPLQTAQGVLVTAIIRDITARKRAEEAIKSLNEDLKRRTIDLETINKELEAFSYSVSHDLRAPLRVIDGFSQALLEDYEGRLDEEGKDYLQRLRRSARQMAGLIDDLLRLSRIGRAEMRLDEVNLSALAREVAKGLQQTDSSRPVEWVIAPALRATGDLPLLRVALENLLGNAWKFTGRRALARIEFGAIAQDDDKVFFVRDNGAGFDMAYADKLFTPFQRLHTAEEFAGTGIGLALVQRIIHRHGGRVWAEGTVDQGATFYFTLASGERAP